MKRNYHIMQKRKKKQRLFRTAKDLALFSVQQPSQNKDFGSIKSYEENNILHEFCSILDFKGQRHYIIMKSPQH